MTADVAERTEAVGPTTERLRKALAIGGRVEMPIEDRRVVRRAWRMVNVVETMHRDGKLTAERWEAWQRFHRAWVAAEMGPRVIQQYGDRFGGGGTPESQVTAEAFDMGDAREVRRVMQREHVRDALEAVSAPGLQRVLVMAAGVECSLETIGRSVSSLADRKQVIAVAAALIDTALWLLYCHYRNLYGQDAKAP